MEKFIVQVLDDKEFDSLPYDGIKDSLGFADVRKGMAFIRNTGNKEFDLGTISHEVNHLIEKHGKEHPDWENGVLHKKGGAARSFVPAILGTLASLINPALGAIVGAASNIGMDQYAKSNHPEQLGQPGKVGDILGAGALGAISAYGGGNALKGGIAGGTQAAPGFLSKAGGVLSGAAVGTAPQAGVSGTSGAIGSGGNLLGMGTGSLNALPVPSGTSALSSSLPSGTAAARAASAALPGTTFRAVPQSGMGLLGQVGAFNAVNSSSKAIPSMALPASSPVSTPSSSTPAMSLANGNIGNASGQALTNNAPLLGNVQAGAGGGSSILQAPVVKAPATSGFSFKELITPNNVIGGASLLGSIATPSPQFQMPDSVEELRKKLIEGQGLSPLGQQAQAELGNILRSSPQELYSPANDAYYAETNRVIDEQYGQAKRQLDAAYNNAGMLGSGEYMAELNKLMQAQANAKSAFAQTENQRRFELARTDKYRAIQDSLGVDKNTMDNLVGLTGLDVQTAAMLYGAKVADVQAIRESLGTLGVELISRGQSPNQQSFMNTPILK